MAFPKPHYDLILPNKNEYLQTHPRAKLEIALKQVNQRATRLNIAKWVACASDFTSDLSSRKISVHVDESKRKEISLLAGVRYDSTNAQ